MLCNSERNQIKAKGCKYLTKASIGALKNIKSKYYSKNKGWNKIGSEGVHHLSKEKWKNMQRLFLST
jgi:hypothetical protein